MEEIKDEQFIIGDKISIGEKFSGKNRKRILDFLKERGLKEEFDRWRKELKKKS